MTSHKTMASLLLEIVEQGLCELRKPDLQIGVVLQSAQRLASLQHDDIATYWISHHQVTKDDVMSRSRRISELVRALGAAQAKIIQSQEVKSYIVDRSVRPVDEDFNIDTEPSVYALSGRELDDEIETTTETLSKMEARRDRPMGYTDGHVHMIRIHRDELRKVRTRIAARVEKYILDVEANVRRGEILPDIFRTNREQIDACLFHFSPTLLAILQEAVVAASSSASERWSHAMTSCRRALKSLADLVYPAGTPRRDANGRDRDLTDDKFKNRLLQFLDDNMTERTFRDLVVKDMESLVGVINRLNDVSSKGVHAEVSQAEAVGTVMRVYTLVGDFVRLLDTKAASRR